METNRALKYRADIDGLRALAVLGVLIFHGGSKTLSGGYVGVDIFFVISGFLITSIIDFQVREGSFSYQKFWLKRIRRIFPASFVCVVVSIFLYSFLLSPSDYLIFGKSLLSLGLFSSNIFFWRELGYFAQNAEEFPLLHTWSLSIEEQFYVFLPLFLIFLQSYFKNKKAFFFLLATVLSFLGCVYLTPRYPSATFYLLPTRAWELGLGSLLALTSFNFSSIKERSREFLNFLALLMMIVPMFCFDKNTLFPGFYAGIPSLGAALFIALPDSNNGLKKVFSHPLILFIGKISYSLYLWHWIVFVAIKHASFNIPDRNFMFIGGLLSIFLAVLSYLYIEEPVRRNLTFWSSKRLWAFFAINMGVFLGIGSLIIYSEGWPHRFDGNFVDFKKKSVIPKVEDYCQKKEGVICTASDNGANNQVFLWGDSHAQSYLEVFKKISNENNIDFKFSITPACPLLFNTFVSGQSKEWNQKCHKATESVLKFLKTYQGKVFISFRYDLYFNKRREYEAGFMKELFLYNSKGDLSSKKESLNLLKRNFSFLLNELEGKSLIFMRQVPAFKYHPGETLNKSQILGKKFDYLEKRNVLELRVKSFEDYVKDKKVTFLDTWAPFCDSTLCTTNIKKEGQTLLFYYDDDHLNIDGARLLKTTIENLL